jgi:hypothetical protein
LRWDKVPKSKIPQLKIGAIAPMFDSLATAATVERL